MGNEGATRISQKLRLLAGAEVSPSCTLRRPSAWPLAHPGAGKGASVRAVHPGKRRTPKAGAGPGLAGPGDPGHSSPVTTLVSRPRCAHVRSPGASSSAAGGPGQVGKEIPRLLENLGNSRFSSLKPVVTHRKELGSKGLKSRGGGTFSR